MRFLFGCLVLISLIYGGWWLWDSFPPLRAFVEEKITTKEFHTLEIRYTADEIFAAHKQELLRGKEYTLLEPKVTFYPYLLMEVKYILDQNSTGEGLLLWGLMDGEMVIDVSTWEKSHGFEDVLNTKADKDEFKILQTLADNGGTIDREQLYHKLQVDPDVLDHWIENCRQKKLLVIAGNKLRLHFHNPRLKITPETRLDEYLVTHSTKSVTRTKKKYTPSQISKLALIAFGNDFAIRKMSEVFLPVYTLSVQNPDGSILTTYWNALNGKRMELSAK